jgi:hypothetical protein
LVAYVAVRYLGYWSEAMVTLADAPNVARVRAAKALDALLAAARPEAVLPALDLPPHPILDARPGHAIGLSLDEGEAARLQPGGVYSFTVGAADETAGHALLSAMVAVGPHGNEILWRDA